MMRSAPAFVLTLLAAGLAASCRGRPQEVAPDAATAGSDAGSAARGRLVILALDGIDPDWLSGWIQERRLPEIERLRERGGALYWLRTTQPPTCEAAWTAFATGLAPADSGVFGPVRRDPATRRPAPGAIDEDLGRAPPSVIARRSGTAFWRTLSDAGVKARVLWAPWELPPEPMLHGEVLAGAGVPSLESGESAGVLLGAAFPESAPGTSRIRLEPVGDAWQAAIPGPPVPGSPAERAAVQVGFRIRESADPGLRRLIVSGPAGPVEAPAGAWSARLPLTFEARGVRAGGLARFLAFGDPDEPLLYSPPVEVDPARPWFPVSSPDAWSAELASRHAVVPLGGPPGSLPALRDGLLSDDAFLAAWIDDLEARRAVLLDELDRGGFDLFVAFLPTAEPVTRAMYRHLDPAVPGHDPAAAERPVAALGGARLHDAVLATYAFLDDVVGRVAERLGPADVLFVLSDHGFHPVQRVVHLNTWLRREGLLVVRRGDAMQAAMDATRDRPRGLADLDWSLTQAYAVGPGAVYLNLEGREPGGIVEPGDRQDAVIRRIEEKLREWSDADAGGTRVVRRVLVRGRDYAGRRDGGLPDLMIAFEPGYRTSDETAGGYVPDVLIEPAHSIFAAEHRDADADGTEGFLFSTRPMARTDPSVEDVGATALAWFGLLDPEVREGRDLRTP